MAKKKCEFRKVEVDRAAVDPGAFAWPFDQDAAGASRTRSKGSSSEKKAIED